jgi:hypothetical protein
VVELIVVVRRLGRRRRVPIMISRVLGFVLAAVFAQIFRNWLLLHAVGVDERPR